MRFLSEAHPLCLVLDTPYSTDIGVSSKSFTTSNQWGLFRVEAARYCFRVGYFDMHSRWFMQAWRERPGIDGI